MPHRHPHRRRRHHHQQFERAFSDVDDVQLPAGASQVDLATPQLDVKGALVQGDRGPTYDELCGLSSTRRKIIGTTPAGQAALLAHDNASQAQKLKKLQGHPDPKVANAAHTLHAAKKGDKRAQKKVALVHEAARQGHPEGVAAMRRLHAVDQATRGGHQPSRAWDPSAHHNVVERLFHNVADAFRHGGTRYA